MGRELEKIKLVYKYSKPISWEEYKETIRDNPRFSQETVQWLDQILIRTEKAEKEAKLRSQGRLARRPPQIRPK